VWFQFLEVTAKGADRLRSVGRVVVLEDARQAPSPSARSMASSLGQPSPMAKAASDESPGTGTIREPLEQGAWAVGGKVRRIASEPQKNPLPGAALDGQCHRPRAARPRSKDA